MARTLSSIATNLLLIALAATAAPRAAAAAEDVRITNPANSVDNPFVSKPVKQQSMTRPASGPQSFQNPFADRSTAPTSPGAKLPKGPMNRWRRPGIASTPSLDASISAAAEEVPSQQAWDVLTPADLKRRLDHVVAEGGGAPVRFEQPPDPTHYEPRPLQQPSWLGAETDKSDDGPSLAAAAPIPHDPADSEVIVTDTSNNNLLSSLQAARTTPVAAPDPFGETTAPVGPPIDSLNATESYARAQQIASEAQTLKEMSMVVELCRHGLACNPSRAETTSMRSLAAWAANRRGEMQSDDGREDDATTSFEEALELDPYCWLALHNRAVSRAQQGQVDAALADFNRALNLNPGLAVAYRNRGELLASLGRTEEAVADYNRAIQQLPQDADLHMMRGHALHRLGKYPLALEDLNQAIAIAPKDFEAYSHRGNIYAELGNYRQATEDFHQALRLNPESADAFRSVAWLLATCPDARFRNAEKALMAAEQAAHLAPPGDPFVLEAQAAAHACAGQYEQAVRFQQQAVSIAPQGFSDQFASRLALYQQNKPFRNSASTHMADTSVQAASLQMAPR